MEYAAAPQENLCAEGILSHWGNCPWQVRVLDRIDSTNNEAKRLAAQGAPHGTAILTGCQTGGRGRLGRQFASPKGGLYLSVLLRPKGQLSDLLHLTPMAAVAARCAIEKSCGLQTQIKWTNDLVFERQKIGGILTELASGADSMAEYAIIGIGINCNTDLQDLPPDVRPMAASLGQIAGRPVDVNALAAALLAELFLMNEQLLTRRSQWLEEYASACMTIGKTVQVLRGETRRRAFAYGIDEQGCLLVRYENGEEAAVSSGEVSVRGMYRYVE